jgi:UDPglucose--hexose-1-phosphate uridylyltransferase
MTAAASLTSTNTARNANRVRTTRTRLADGRQLIYFDEAGSIARKAIDTRDLQAATVASELRFDVICEEWVVIATHRQDRTHLPPGDACPLCPSTTERTSEIPATDYDVVVFDNRYPSLSDTGAPPANDDVGEALFPNQPAAGHCEVVCFSSNHDSAFADLPPSRARTVIDAWADRTEHLSRLPGVAQVFPFENRGEEIGVTLAHPHGQIYAYPFVTPRTQRMLASAQRHHERTGRNLFADVLEAERRANQRIVLRSDHWTAFVPAAARWPVEVHLYPNRRVSSIPELSDDERDDLAVTYLELLQRLDRLHGMPLPYIAGWQQAPVHANRRLTYLHLQLFSIRRSPQKLKYLAGSESAMGAFINDVAPEHSAQLLRDAAN